MRPWSNEPQSKHIANVMNHVLTLNNFTFNGTNYLPVKGCAMDTIAATSYATIFMYGFEEKLIHPHLLANCLMNYGFIDDIFLISTLPVAFLLSLYLIQISDTK